MVAPLQKLSKAKAPLGNSTVFAGNSLSIAAVTSAKLQESAEEKTLPPEKLPADHFAENDLQEEWLHFLKNLHSKDALAHLAIRDFKLKKSGENEITVEYPSESALREFEKISPQFLADLRVKTNNFLVEIKFIQDQASRRREVITKKQIFADLVKVNPLLAELDAFLKFDLNE